MGIRTRYSRLRPIYIAELQSFFLACDSSHGSQSAVVRLQSCFWPTVLKRTGSQRPNLNLGKGFYLGLCFIVSHLYDELLV